MTASLNLGYQRECPRIEHIEITPVAVQDPPLLAASGMHEPWTARTIIEIICEGGIAGLAETYGDTATLDDLRAIAPRLTGLRVTDAARVHKLIATHMSQTSVMAQKYSVTSPRTDPSLRSARIFAAFEAGMLDAHARAIGVPLAELLGGVYREQIPFAAYLFFKAGSHDGLENSDVWGEVLTPGALVEEAGRMVERHGFQSLKLKGGVLEPEEEVECLEALAQAFPGVPLRIDPNGNWTVETTFRILPALNRLVQYLEDPVLGHENMAKVRERAAVPLATNMCVTSFADLPAAMKTGSVDLVLSDPHYWGGLHETIKLDRVCRAFGWGLAMHSNTHLGVSMMTMAHTAAACPGMTYDADTHYPWVTKDVVTGDGIGFEDGAIRISQKPGLGIELDRAALAQMAASYAANPSPHRDDTYFMRKRWPSWTPERPRF